MDFNQNSHDFLAIVFGKCLHCSAQGNSLLEQPAKEDSGNPKRTCRLMAAMLKHEGGVQFPFKRMSARVSSIEFAILNQFSPGSSPSMLGCAPPRPPWDLPMSYPTHRQSGAECPLFTMASSTLPAGSSFWPLNRAIHWVTCSQLCHPPAILLPLPWLKVVIKDSSLAHTLGWRQPHLTCLRGGYCTPPTWSTPTSTCSRRVVSTGTPLAWALVP